MRSRTRSPSNLIELINNLMQREFTNTFHPGEDTMHAKNTAQCQQSIDLGTLHHLAALHSTALTGKE